MVNPSIFHRRASAHLQTIILTILILVFCLSLKTALAVVGELSKEEYEKNRVVVRIWHHRDFGGNSVGHVCVHLPQLEEYASFWPFPPPKLPVQVVHGVMNTLIGDYGSEGRT